jgi:hypothetical protein
MNPTQGTPLKPAVHVRSRSCTLAATAVYTEEAQFCDDFTDTSQSAVHSVHQLKLQSWLGFMLTTAASLPCKRPGSDFYWYQVQAPLP